MYVCLCVVRVYACVRVYVCIHKYSLECIISNRISGKVNVEARHFDQVGKACDCVIIPYRRVLCISPRVIS